MNPPLKWTLIAILILGLVCVAVSAQAQPRMPCAPRTDIVNRLAQKYDERPVSMGVSANGHVVEVFAGPAGNWTLVVTRPDGTACLLASGQAWETLIDGEST